jgi:hypothetical protein
MKLFALVAYAAILPVLAAQTRAPQHTQSNPELKIMFQEDQRIRSGSPLSPEERARIVRTDADRLAAVKQILLANQIQTAEDYLNASVILQHGSKSEDYLLAHTLAVIGSSKGDKVCTWLSAATLDRYLQSIGQPQIYGTQSKFSADAQMTQEPYTTGLVTDTLRKELGVPPLADQKKRVEAYRQQPGTKTQ